MTTPPIGADRSAPAVARRSAATPGFTLVETLVVLVLLGLAATVAVANLNSIYQRSRAESEARELAAFLSSVPDQARSIHEPVFLVFDAGAGSFVISPDAGGVGILDQHRVKAPMSVGGSFAALLRCDPMGRAFLGTSVSMLTSQQTLDLTNAAATGEPRVSFRLAVSPLWSVLVEKRVES